MRRVVAADNVSWEISGHERSSPKRIRTRGMGAGHAHGKSRRRTVADARVRASIGSCEREKEKGAFNSPRKSGRIDDVEAGTTSRDDSERVANTPAYQRFVFIAGRRRSRVRPATAEIYDSGGFTVLALASRSNTPREESMAIPLSGKAPLNRKMTPHDGTRHVCRERCNFASRLENVERDREETFLKKSLSTYYSWYAKSTVFSLELYLRGVVSFYKKLRHKESRNIVRL